MTRALLTKGVFTALVTPFKNGKLDTENWIQLIERQAEAGIHGVVIAGTTGESPTLTEEEVTQLTKLAKKHASEMKLVVGVGGNNTAQAIHRSQLAHDVGADAVLAVTPYYNKPPAWALQKHYEMLADKCPLPIILYNVPGRTAVDLLPDLVVTLAAHSKFIALKDASGHVERLTDLRSRLSDSGFGLFCGDDPLWLPALAAGATGIISVMSNVWPEAWVQIYDLHQQGASAKALEVFSAFSSTQKIVFSVTNPIGIKWIGAQRGYWNDECRLPLVPLSQAPKELLRAFQSIEIK